MKSTLLEQTNDQEKINRPNQSDLLPSIYRPEMVLDKVNKQYIKTVNLALPHKYACQYQKLETKASMSTFYKLIPPDKNQFTSINIFSCPELLDIHANPLLVNKKLLAKTQTSTQLLLKNLYYQPEFSWFKSAIDHHEFLELCLLYGGRGYRTQQAFQDEFNYHLPLCELNIKRTDETDGWGYKIIEKDTNFSQIKPNTKNQKIIVTDTAATLTSFVHSMEIFLAEARKQNSSISNVLFYSIGGSSFAAYKLKKYEQFVREKYQWTNFNINYVVANALFGQDENGTDLAYRHSNIYIPPNSAFLQLLSQQPWIKYNKCCVYDWGDRVSLELSRNLNHLLELKEYYLQLQKDPLIQLDQQTSNYIKFVLKQCQTEISAHILPNS